MVGPTPLDAPSNETDPSCSSDLLPMAADDPLPTGLILQRGGEELVLSRLPDRFAVRFRSGRLPEALLQHLQPQASRSIASVQLMEIQVLPEHLEQAMEMARGAEEVAFASHVYRLQASPNTQVYLTNQLTIQFADTVDRTSIGATMASLGLKAVQAVPGVPQTFVFQVTGQAIVNPIKLANQLMQRPDVLTAEPNIAIEQQWHYRPHDPDYAKQWYLNHQGGPGLAPDSHIAVEAAWEITRGVRSVVVAIADDGFDLNHPDFQGKGKLAHPKDFKGRDELPLPDAAHENHGTACAGVAIAEENGVGIVGVAPGCAFMPIRTSGVLDDTTLEALFNWVIQKGASVVSCSWGPAAIYFPLSLRQRAAISRAATEGRQGKGCVIVFASGNANRPTQGSINEQGWPRQTVNGPTQWMNGFALHPDVIVVSACTSLNRKAAYSNWGRSISVAAPSDNGSPGTWLPDQGFVFTGPVVETPLSGEGIFTSDRLGSAGYGAGSFTHSFGGTSSACPVVAGVAALMLSVNPNLTAQEVKHLLQATADKIVDGEADIQLGYQRGSYDGNGHSQWFGYGKVNAFNAVLAAQQKIPRRSPPSRYQTFANPTTVAIPDANPQGVSSAIAIATADPVRDIQIAVEVEHPFLGDVSIRLLPPGGLPILLQGRTLGRQSHLDITYTLQTTPLLQQWLHRSAAGTWRLHLVDRVPMHAGRLLRWQIILGW